MKRFFIYFAIIILPLTAIFALGLAHQAQGGRVPVKGQYRDKIIYDVTGRANPQPLQTDCAKRGGTFFAAACADCAPRCEFQTDERVIVPGWTVYDDDQLGITLNHPQDMVVHKSKPKEVSLMMWGPSQKQSGGLTDGISVRITRDSYPPILSFEEYVEQRLLDAQAAGKQILSASPVTVGRLSGEGYRTFEHRQTMHVLFPVDNHQAIALEYVVVDPEQQGFDRVIDRIISSLRLSEILAMRL